MNNHWQPKKLTRPVAWVGHRGINPILAAMISMLTGQFADKSPTRVVVNVQGVGYEVHISLTTYTWLQPLTQGTLHTHLKVSEDAFTLYGFATLAEKELFLKLIGVSGVGAATARMMLSSMGPADLVAAIATGQVKLLEGIKGIGKKTAERIVLELRDKLGQLPAGGGSVGVLEGANNSPDKDALEALVALGIARPVAEAALRKASASLPPQASVEERIKHTLKSI